jgi:hypothetical protein
MRTSRVVRCPPVTEGNLLTPIRQSAGPADPDGKVGLDALAVIRETIRDMNMVAIDAWCSPTLSTSSRSVPARFSSG